MRTGLPGLQPGSQAFSPFSQSSAWVTTIVAGEKGPGVCRGARTYLKHPNFFSFCNPGLPPSPHTVRHLLPRCLLLCFLYNFSLTFTTQPTPGASTCSWFRCVIWLYPFVLFRLAVFAWIRGGAKGHRLVHLSYLVDSPGSLSRRCWDLTEGWRLAPQLEAWGLGWAGAGIYGDNVTSSPSANTGPCPETPRLLPPFSPLPGLTLEKAPNCWSSHSLQEEHVAFSAKISGQWFLKTSVNFNFETLS